MGHRTPTSRQHREHTKHQKHHRCSHPTHPFVVRLSVSGCSPSVDALPIDGKEMPQPHLAHRLALDSYGAAAGVTGNVNQMAPPYFGYYRPDSSDSMMASNSDNEDGFGGTGPFVPFLMAPGDFKAFDRADDESEENAWLGVICNNTPQ
uniref:Uncharacterized protein n=1 Tax=Vitrella brassicaformis TaxID=1169539 RepID=A0A7S1KHC4_9ALVE